MVDNATRMANHDRISNCYVYILLTFFVCCAYLLIFSYADGVTQVSERLRSPRLRHNRRRGNINNESLNMPVYSWKCQEKKCEKSLLRGDQYYTSLETCNMMCVDPQLWPKPQEVITANRSFSLIRRNTIAFNITCEGLARRMLQNVTDNHLRNLDLLKEKYSSGIAKTDLEIMVNVEDDTLLTLDLGTNESYRLNVTKTQNKILASVTGHNYFGVRHGLETLFQLIWIDESSKELLILHDVYIRDYPVFPYRGVMIDTARNFFPLQQLKKVVDGMSASKLNVLHLHLTDSFSFPVVLPRVQELAKYGAYGPDMVYRPQDLRELIEYARIGGIRLVLEVDAPSHVYAGWNMFGDGLVICGDSNIFGSHLNPDNEEVLDILEDIYSDLLDIVDHDEIFHIGGDEVDLNCWRKTKSSIPYSDTTELWADFTNQMLERLRVANNNRLPKNIVIWSSKLTASRHMSKLQGNVTVQFWLGDPNNFLSLGYSVIFSTVGHWYLDCGFGKWRPDMDHGVCDPYTPWETVYKYRPWKEHYRYRKQILGAEVCLWTEQVEVDTLETRLWPRAAAFAERVWSDPVEFSDYDVYARMVSFKDRLSSKGIKVAGMWPRWCSQNPGKCGFR